MSKLRPVHLALILAATYLAVLWITAPDVGFTRDEGYYFKAAEDYSRWFGVLFSKRFFDAFTDAEIMKHFSYNTEHPVLVKLLQGVTHHLFSSWLGLTSPSTGFRITGFLFSALAMFTTYLLGRELVSERAGLLAAVLLALLPRFFYDAHLACFDVPMTAMWTWSLYTFHRALTAPPEEARSRALIAGLVFGLALATKLNAFFLPFVYVALWLIAPQDRAERSSTGFVRGPSGGWDLRLPPIPRVLLACAIIGPLVFIAHWPYLWHDTFARIGGYLAFHMRHEHYPILYYGELLVKPPFPWSFPVVMTYYTVPSPILALGGIGLLVAIARALKDRSLGDALLVIATVLPIFLIALPSTPIFGGVKHWYNAMPSLMILTARALFDSVDWARRRWLAPIAVALAIGPGLFGIIASHPNGIGFYNELAGGYRGGAELGMQRVFWGGVAAPLFRDLPSGRVFFNRTNYDSYRMYRRENVIRPDVSYANDAKFANAGVVFEQPEHGEREAEVWSAIGTRPVDGVYQDNVGLIQLYVEGKSDRPPN
jgi:4-amino-4-deoxy-L-arabinose transferase-like glycosyltransferase